MDKGRAIKIGVAVVVLVIAIVLIVRALGGGGPPVEGEQQLGVAPHAPLLPLA